VGAAAVGLALAAPLLLPGLQVIAGSNRLASIGYQGLPVVTSVNLAFAGFYGFPTANSVYFGPLNYYETAAYVGLIVLVLAGLAVLSRWREAEVKALTITTAVLLASSISGRWHVSSDHFRGRTSTPGAGR